MSALYEKEEASMYENAEQAYKENKGLIIKEAKRFMRNGIEFEDLMQTAYLAVNNAFDSFDETRGISFGTFLTTCVKRSFVRETISFSGMRMPEHMRYRVRVYCAVKEKLKRRLPSEPTEAELAEKIGCSVKKLRKTAAISSCFSISLDEIMKNEGSREFNSLKYYDGGYDAAEYDVFKQKFWEDIEEIISDERLYRILRLRFTEEKMLKEIGEMMGIKVEAVQSKLNSAIRRLRKSEIMKYYKNLIE